MGDKEKMLCVRRKSVYLMDINQYLNLKQAEIQHISADYIMLYQKGKYCGFVKNNYPYIEIPIPEGKKLGKTNFITITYYYEDNNNLVKLSINGKTVQQYYVKDIS